jgi:hypothetical protein
VIEITVPYAALWKHSTVSNKDMPDSDVCWQCKDAATIVLQTGEMYRVCAPSKWKSYECAARLLATLKKPAAHAELKTRDGFTATAGSGLAKRPRGAV